MYNAWCMMKIAGDLFKVITQAISEKLFLERVAGKFVDISFCPPLPCGYLIGNFTSGL